MPHTPRTRERPPIRVKDVDKPSPVPFLRAFDWISVAMRSFREKPIPSTYTTEAVPTFDLFGNERISEVQFEFLFGTLGGIELVGPVVPPDRSRFYLSMAFLHTDTIAVTHSLQAIRVLNVLGAFPQVPFQDPNRNGSALANFWYTARNFTAPPESFAGVSADAMGAAARLFVTSAFIEYPIGEPRGDIS